MHGRWRANLGRAEGQILRSHPLPPPKVALEGKVPQRRPQKRLDRRLEEVAKAVGGGYCRLQMPLKLALAVGTYAWTVIALCVLGLLRVLWCSVMCGHVCLCVGAGEGGWIGVA